MLAEIRERYASSETSLTLDDVRFLVEFAMCDYDMSADQVADNITQLVTGDPEPMIRHLAGGPPAPEPRRPVRSRMGVMSVVDTYVCERNDEIAVRIAHGKDALGEIQCPVCEHAMIRIDRRLRKGEPPDRPDFEWSRKALATNLVKDGQ